MAVLAQPASSAISTIHSRITDARHSTCAIGHSSVAMFRCPMGFLSSPSSSSARALRTTSQPGRTITATLFSTTGPCRFLPLPVRQSRSVGALTALLWGRSAPQLQSPRQLVLSCPSIPSLVPGIQPSIFVSARPLALAVKPKAAVGGAEEWAVPAVDLEAVAWVPVA